MVIKMRNNALKPTVLIGQQIRRIRKEKGLKIEDLAARIQKTISTVSKYEHGSIVLDIDTLFEISNALEVEPQELINMARPLAKAPDTGMEASPFARDSEMPFRLFAYQYDGRLKRVTKSLLYITPNKDDLNPNVIFYLDVPDFSHFNLCRYYYHGTMYSYDTIIHFSLTNPFNSFGKVSICATNPYHLQHLNKKSINTFTGSLWGSHFSPLPRSLQSF